MIRAAEEECRAHGKKFYGRSHFLYARDEDSDEIIHMNSMAKAFSRHGSGSQQAPDVGESQLQDEIRSLSQAQSRHEKKLQMCTPLNDARLAAFADGRGA